MNETTCSLACFCDRFNPGILISILKFWKVKGERGGVLSLNHVEGVEEGKICQVDLLRKRGLTCPPLFSQLVQ